MGYFVLLVAAQAPLYYLGGRGTVRVLSQWRQETGRPPLSRAGRRLAFLCWPALGLFTAHVFLLRLSFDAFERRGRG